MVIYPCQTNNVADIVEYARTDTADALKIAILSDICCLICFLINVQCISRRLGLIG